MSATLVVDVFKYDIDTTTLRGKADYQDLTRDLKKRGMKSPRLLRGVDLWQVPSAIIIYEEGIFSDHIKQGDVSTIYDWAEIATSTSKKKQGYFITNETFKRLRKIRERIYSCSLCGERYPPQESITFCPQCVKSGNTTLNVNLMELRPLSPYLREFSATPSDIEQTKEFMRIYGSTNTQ